MNVFCPNAESDILTLLREPDAWTEARQHVGALKLYSKHVLSDAPGPGIGANCWPALLEAGLKERLHEWGWHIWVEVGALKEWDLDGQRILRGEAETILDRLQTLGVPITLALDEPLTATMVGRFRISPEQLPNTPENLRQQAAALRHWIAAVRWSGVGVNLIEAYPYNDLDAIIKMGLYSDVHTVELDIDPKAMRHGDANIDSVTRLCIDRAIVTGTLEPDHHPWWQFWHWGRTPSPEETYHRSVLRHAALVRRLLGDVPLTVQSWARDPDGGLTRPANLPMSDPQSHTAILRAVLSTE